MGFRVIPLNFGIFSKSANSKTYKMYQEYQGFPPPGRGLLYFNPKSDEFNEIQWNSLNFLDLAKLLCILGKTRPRRAPGVETPSISYAFYRYFNSSFHIFFMIFLDFNEILLNLCKFHEFHGNIVNLVISAKMT